MDTSARNQVIEQFQLAFSEVCEDQIRGIIRECREEALAEAKQILRDRTLNNVLEAVVNGAGQRPSVNPVPSSEIRTGHTQVRAQVPKMLEKSGNGPAVLNDRILEEIEAIREQILRNEQLLSQIKPILRSNYSSKE